MAKVAFTPAVCGTCRDCLDNLGQPACISSAALYHVCEMRNQCGEGVWTTDETVVDAATAARRARTLEFFGYIGH